MEGEVLQTPRSGNEGATEPSESQLGNSGDEAKWMTLTWFARPDRYEGEVLQGHMHGKGTYWHADGSRYEGAFAKSKRHGYGEYYYADGSVYKGEYKDGIKEGHGVFVFPDKTRYEGTFRNNVKHGKGITYYADGSQYVGDYKQGLMDGHGEYVRRYSEYLHAWHLFPCAVNGRRYGRMGSNMLVTGSLMFATALDKCSFRTTSPLTGHVGSATSECSPECDALHAQRVERKAASTTRAHKAAPNVLSKEYVSSLVYRGVRTRSHISAEPVEFACTTCVRTPTPDLDGW